MSSTAWVSRIQAFAGVIVAISVAAPVWAQGTITPQTVTLAQTYDPAPWWMDQPVIASTGMVQTEMLANRATFDASFQALANTVPDATKAAAEKVRTLGVQLATYGPERVRAAFSFEVNPIYQQYRDKDGNLVDNERPDKIDSYQVSAKLSVEVRDVSLIERVYGAVVSAKPSEVAEVHFTLEPDNDIRTALYGQAVEDAARRARQAAQAAGAQLGPAKLVDPTGRACQTDVLVSGAARFGNAPNTSFTNVTLPAPTDGRPAPSSGAPGGAAGDIQIPVQPPLLSLQQTACVVYSLG